MAESWEAGHPVESDRCATFADGLAVRVAIPLAVDVLGEVASRMLLVSEREIARAVGAFADAGIRVEGAAAAALAALPQLDDVDGPDRPRRHRPQHRRRAVHAGTRAPRLVSRLSSVEAPGRRGRR